MYPYLFTSFKLDDAPFDVNDSGNLYGWRLFSDCSYRVGRWRVSGGYAYQSISDDGIGLLDGETLRGFYVACGAIW